MIVEECIFGFLFAHFMDQHVAVVNGVTMSEALSWKILRNVSIFLLLSYPAFWWLFQMLDEPHFSTPPSSPPPSMHVQGYEKPHNFKASSVSWCTDYMEVMGCEKPHNFKVSDILLALKVPARPCQCSPHGPRGDGTSLVAKKTLPSEPTLV